MYVLLQTNLLYLVEQGFALAQRNSNLSISTVGFPIFLSGVDYTLTISFLNDLGNRHVVVEDYS